MQAVVETGVRPAVERLSERRPAAYSLSVSREEMRICQCGKLVLTASSQAPIRRFAGVDLLAATDQTDDHRPIRVAVHVGDQELRFGLLESRPLLSPLHEIRVCGSFQAR